MLPGLEDKGVSMREISKIRTFLFGLLGAAVVTAPALVMAQDRAPSPLRDRLRDALKDVIERELQNNDDDAPEQQTDDPDGDPQRPDSSGERVTINFEDIRGRTASARIELTTQYQKSYGLTFGSGATAYSCQGPSPVQITMCPYLQAASGDRAVLHEVRSGGPAMTLSFERAISSLSVKINPTGGELDEEFIARVTGYDANNRRQGTNNTRFNWFQDAGAWPTTASVQTKDGTPLSRVTIELLRIGADNQPVRFLIDDLSFVYAEDVSAPPETPVIADLLEAEDRAPALVIVDRYTSAVPSNDRRGLALYPPAQRIRVAVDWDSAFAARDRQSNAGLNAAPIAPLDDLARIAMPVLLPENTDAPIDLATDDAGDSYSAIFEKGGRAFDFYGTRVMTATSNDGGGASTANLKFHELEYGLAASFSLYGVSYRLT